MSKKIDFDALDHMDIVVVDMPWGPGEAEEFSAFLLKRKESRLAKEKRATLLNATSRVDRGRVGSTRSTGPNIKKAA